MSVIVIPITVMNHSTQFTLWHFSGAPLEAFGLLAQQMLEDAQERLSYRTQAYIQSDIQVRIKLLHVLQYNVK